MKKVTKNQYGFTLLETLVALVITVSAAAALVMAWGGNNLRLRKTTLNNNIAQLLERKMIEMEAKYSGKAFTEIKDEEGDFGEDFGNYRWSFKTQPFEMPDMSPLLAGKDNKAVDQTLLTVISKMREAINKAVLEVTVTVYFKGPKGETSHKVTTYFVDYEAEPSLTGGS